LHLQWSTWNSCNLYHGRFLRVSIKSHFIFFMSVKCKLLSYTCFFLINLVARDLHLKVNKLEICYSNLNWNKLTRTIHVVFNVYPTLTNKLSNLIIYINSLPNLFPKIYKTESSLKFGWMVSKVGSRIVENLLTLRQSLVRILTLIYSISIKVKKEVFKCVFYIIK
jgi:stage III sporulation protein SpoIIIAA